MFGKNNFNWRGGISKDRWGYIRIFIPKHPYSVYKYIFEHRLIIETYIKRYLLPKEIVHHINNIKDDNRPENLMAFTSQSVHKRFEKKLPINPKNIIFDGRKFLHNNNS